MECLRREICTQKDSDCISNNLEQFWLFKNFTPSEIAVLNREAQPESLLKGQLLFTQSEPANGLFLIKRGRVKLVKKLEDGSRPILDIRKTGDFIGETVFSDQGQYPVSAVCLEDTTIDRFTQKQFEKLIFKNPNIGIQVIKNLSNRILWLTSRLGSMTVTNIEDRLYSILRNIAKEHGVASAKGLKVQFSVTHEDLSFLTGAHRVTISRTMKTLKEAGKVIFENRRVILPVMNPA